MSSNKQNVRAGRAEGSENSGEWNLIADSSTGERIKIVEDRLAGLETELAALKATAENDRREFSNFKNATNKKLDDILALLRSLAPPTTAPPTAAAPTATATAAPIVPGAPIDPGTPIVPGAPIDPGTPIVPSAPGPMPDDTDRDRVDEALELANRLRGVFYWA